MLPPLPPIPSTGLNDPHIQKWMQSLVTNLNNINPQIEHITPVTGFVHTIGNNVSQLIIEPQSGLVSGSAILPVKPIDNQNVGISSTQAISVFNLSPSTGQTLNGGITSLTSNVPATWQYRAKTQSWYRVA